MVKTYAEKLKDPRWIVKRNEVLIENGFCCEKCGDHESRLHVHHNSYFKNREPWDYEISQFSVLCYGCHEGYHDSFDPLLHVVSLIGVDKRETRSEVAALIAGYFGLEDKRLVSHFRDKSGGWFRFGQYYLKGKSIKTNCFKDILSEKQLIRLSLLLKRFKAICG